MPDNLTPNSSLNHLTSRFDGDDPTWAISVTEPSGRTVAAAVPAQEEPAVQEFWPEQPSSLQETGLRPSQIESLILKYLLNFAVGSGRDIAHQLALSFRMVQNQLYELKEAQLVSLKSDAALGDYNYELTQFGLERGRRYAEQSTYFGSAPVPLEQYAASIAAQSVQTHPLSFDDICNAYNDLVLSEEMLSVIGESLNMGRGMFLHGSAGNGKSTIAEHISKAFHRQIWIPRAISVGGEVVRLFDSIHHRAIDRDPSQRSFDARWVCIERPTIVVGGELDLDGFEVTTSPITGISEAPLQLKANAGTLVIDDFGRNRFRPEELLNRLVVPMERGADSLHLKSGRTFRVPFDCMMVFSTNMTPADLVDEAFLRRIPYKVDVADPTEEQFRKIFRIEANSLELKFEEADIEYLLDRHYRQVTGRSDSAILVTYYG